MKIKPDLSYQIFEIITPKNVENPSFKRSKERTWTLNLEDALENAFEDAVIVFPSIEVEDYVKI